MECDDINNCCEFGQEQQNQSKQNSALQSNLQAQPGPVEKKMRQASDYAEYDELVYQLANSLKIARHQDNSITLKAARLLLESHLTVGSSSLLSGGSINNNETNKLKSQLETSDTRLGGDEREIRVQQSKFTLSDISLPKEQLKTASRNKYIDDGDGCSAQKHDFAYCEQNEQREEARVSEKNELEEAFERGARALKLLYLDDQKQLQIQVNEIISAIQSITANPKTDPRLIAIGR